MDELERLAERAGVRLAALERARRRSREELERMRDAVQGLEIPPDACVAVMGSIGRLEMTGGSDVDYAVLAPVDQASRDLLERVNAVLARLGHRPPRPDGPFAGVVSVEELVENIGADPDSNTNMTRRMLLVLESVPVGNAGAWAVAREAVLGRYLSASLKPRTPPRFFLNDVIRYWRSVAVDYEWKMRDRKGEGWAMRNAKLRLSRKMLFAGGLLPLLESARLGSEEIPGFLAERLRLAPVDRVAAAFRHHGAAEVGGRALLAYSQFLGVLDDPTKRAELESLPLEGGRGSAVWREVESLGAAFQRGLDALLFETPLLSTVREYAIF